MCWLVPLVTRMLPKASTVAGWQPALLLLGGAQVGQERRQRGPLGFLGEPGRHVAERVEVRPGQAAGRVGPASRHLHIEPAGMGDLGDQVDQ